MNEEHAKISRLDLLRLAHEGVQKQLSDLYIKEVEIRREIDALLPPDDPKFAGLPSRSYKIAKAIREHSEVVHTPAHRKRRALSAEVRKKMSVAQKKRWATARKEKAHAA